MCVRLLLHCWNFHSEGRGGRDGNEASTEREERKTINFMMESFMKLSMIKCWRGCFICENLTPVSCDSFITNVSMVHKSFTF